MGRLGDWLDARTGYRRIVAGIAEEPVKGGARWAYIFGSVLTFLLVVQAATGVLLAAFYSPSVTTAWASVAFIQDQVPLGWFIRGLHSYGASAMVVVIVAHALQVLLYAAYQAPRELNWLSGLAMAAVVGAFALSGYLLPWDQKGYWATQVATSIMGTMPLLGRAAQKLVQGGAVYGNLTLTRFFVLHTYLLPALVFSLLAVHLALFRKHGVTPKWNVPEAELERKSVPFFPDQLVRDLTACAGVFLVIVLLCVRSHGAELEAPADPASTYLARPEWYFLPLFQLLKYFEGPLEPLGTIVLPGLVGLGLVLLPFRQRTASRAPTARIAVLLGAGVGLGALIWLGARAVQLDRADPAFARQRAKDLAKASRARRWAREGVPAEGGLAVFRNDPQFAVMRLWEEKCDRCHALTGAGGERGPDLKDYNSRAWIARFLRNPDDPLRMGPCKLEKGMKPVKATPDELDALTEFVYRQSQPADARGDLAGRGEALFSDKDCDSCHEVDGESDGQGPNLGSRGTLAYVRAIIEDPGAKRLYGKRNKMPRFRDKLSASELDALARFVLDQAQRP